MDPSDGVCGIKNGATAGSLCLKELRGEHLREGVT